MRSTGGEHYVGLDHIRALAAFLVFEWHFLHRLYGEPIPFEYAPAFWPASLIDEGHIGVALFMTLSGYLFAKLLNGQKVIWSRFFWNRFIRLGPLLIFVLAVNLGTNLRNPMPYLQNVANGFLFPTWPNGGWSITTEMHFYLLMPLLLPVLSRPRSAFAAIIAAICLRALIYWQNGAVEFIAYTTIIGRLDQFALGACCYHFAGKMRSNHIAALGTFFVLVTVYQAFNLYGGYAADLHPVWIVMTTIEGATLGLLISYYDRSFSFKRSALSTVGEVSYSIYLLHFFVIMWLSEAFQAAFPEAGFYASAIAGALCFAAFVPVAWISYRFIEKPYVSLRVPYTETAS